jgi:LCP family protein required for cell wall assembly
MRARDYDIYGYEFARRRRWRIARWTAGVLAMIVAAAVITGYFLYRDLNSNLQALDPDLGSNRPPRVAVPGEREPLNILLIGTDAGADPTRSGVGPDEVPVSELTDTTILLHVSADRDRAYGVSIPRDLVVGRPECPSSDGRMVPADPAAAFGTAYGVGREGCTVRTVEAMTNIRVDHFLVTSFDGLRKTADALGGVPIKMLRQVHDPRLDVTLPAGEYDVKGDEALSYVTMKLGPSGDIGRIRRQQAFLSAMTSKALSTGTLTNPFRLYNFLDEATQAVAADRGLASLGALADLAGDLRAIGHDNVYFLTMPITPYAGGRFAPAPDAGPFWSRLRQDRRLTPEELLGASTGDAAPDKQG